MDLNRRGYYKKSRKIRKKNVISTIICTDKYDCPDGEGYGGVYENICTINKTIKEEKIINKGKIYDILPKVRKGSGGGGGDAFICRISLSRQSAEEDNDRK